MFGLFGLCASCSLSTADNGNTSAVSVHTGEVPDGRSWVAPAFVSVPFEIRSGLPCVKVTVNDKCSRWMIVDTGSQTSIFEAETAKNAGIAQLAPSKLIGVGGSEDARRGRMANLRIGSACISNLSCLIRQHGTTGSAGAVLGNSKMLFNVLGMDAFLGLCSWVALDYRTHRLDLAFSGSYRPRTASTAWRRPLIIREGVPWLRLRSQSEEWWSLLDTGAGSMTDITPEVASSLGLTVVPGAVRAGIGSARSGLEVGEVGLTVLPLLEGAGPDLHDVSAVVGLPPAKLGSGLLRQFKVTLDFSNPSIWIEY